MLDVSGRYLIQLLRAKHWCYAGEPRVVLGPLNEVFGVVGKADSVPLSSLSFLSLRPGLLSLSQRTPARFPMSPSTALVPMEKLKATIRETIPEATRE